MDDNHWSAYCQLGLWWLRRYLSKIMNHPVCSPNLASGDSHPTEPFKKRLGGKQLATVICTLKVKESPNRTGVAQRVPGGLGSQISWHSAHEGGEVVSLTRRPPLPPGMFLVLIFTRGWVNPRAMVRSEGNMSLKNPVTPPGIDPGTVRLVAQRLNHYATSGPCVICMYYYYMYREQGWCSRYCGYNTGWMTDESWFGPR